MKQIAKFVTDDGCEFLSADAAAHHQALCVEIAGIMAALLPADPRGTDFVQQEGSVVLSVQRQLVEIFEREHPRMKDHHTEWARNAPSPAGMTLIGRYIDDCGPAPLNRAWRRIMRMDRKFREYEQPYYAIQADKYGY